MKWNYWLAGSAIALAMVTLSCVAQPKVIAFDDLAEAKSALSALGFSCVSDAVTDDDVFGGFLVSREQFSWQDVGSLCKVGAMGEKWRGKVWLTTSSPDWQLETAPDKAGVRLWGSVIAFGDENLLEEIEAACASAPDLAR